MSSGALRPCGPVLVVDDDEQMRAFLVDTLERTGYATKEAATGEEALEAALDGPAPGLAVLDVCLPGISGYQVCHDLRRSFGSGLPIIFVSAVRIESYDRVAGLLVGGDDYLAKPISPDEFLIRVDRLIHRSAPLNVTVSARLTGREEEVLRLLAEGLGPRDIATRLFISAKTVNTHIDHIFSKLGVHSRAEAVALVYRGDVLETPA